MEKLNSKWIINNTVKFKFWFNFLLPVLSQKSSDDSDENYNNASSSPEAAEIDNGTAGEGGGDGIDSTDNSSNESGESDFSSSSDIDELQDIISQSNNSTNSTSENTTHSYPSSLLEEEDDLLPLPDTGVLHKLLFKSPSLSDLNNGQFKFRFDTLLATIKILWTYI